MKMEIDRHWITIKPEGVIDVAFIEDTLGLKEDGDYIKLKRRNAADLSCIACLETDCEGVYNIDDIPGKEQR